MRIGAVTFDVGGTLIAPWPSVGHVYADATAKAGFPVDPDLLTRRFQAAWQQRLVWSFDYSHAAWRSLVAQTLAGLVPDAFLDEVFEDVYERFAQAETWRTFEDVQPALAALQARGVRLGLISNWDERLRPLLRLLGLDTHFEITLISCEAGCTKPAAALFQQAARAFGLPPSEVLHVGDSPDEDVAGAIRAGLPAVLLRRVPAGTVRGPVVSSLVDLVERLDGLDAQSTRSR
ncbi:MAG TPA: HAD-IA family hydrolase [Methylomirabilota bacterium]|nr:HAD-IA family hydrolase [Methylomirabilota bacterium]